MDDQENSFKGHKRSWASMTLQQKALVFSTLYRPPALAIASDQLCVYYSFAPHPGLTVWLTGLYPWDEPFNERRIEWQFAMVEGRDRPRWVHLDIPANEWYPE